LHDREPLPRWTTDRIALLGDACHPMLPMMAQGAAQAIEDGAALASVLKAMPDDVSRALERYEAVRKPRATRLQELSAVNRTRYHMPDGPEQQKRDELMATSGDRSFAALTWLYAHDAAAAI
jgi:salicylate hydroxylase